jgi:alkaline phosphatase D
MRRALVLLLLLPGISHAEELLHAGPMHAWTELRSTAIWVQTARPAAVQLRYFPAAAPAAARLTPVVATAAAQEHIATFLLSGLEPATEYRYELYIDGSLVERPYPLAFTTQPLWQWRQPAPDFEAMFGSCLYVNEGPYDRPGTPYGSEHEILSAMAARRPDLMLWLGDNLYTREADYFSAAGLAARYRHDRALPELQPFLAATSHYATWDDHDYGPNNSDSTYPLKATSLELFARYWPAPVYGTPDTAGVFQKVSWGDVDFFLLDDRYHRKPNGWPAGADKTMLGRAQMEWLKASLVASKATFKVIANGNQVLNPNSSYERMTEFTDTEELTAWIVRNRIGGVLFLSGDRHHTELIRVQRPGAYPFYDFTSSSITAGPHVIKPDHPEYRNPLRIDGTLLMEHSFGIVRVSGAPQQRRLTLQACGVDGAVRWERTITRDELSFPAAVRRENPSDPTP